MRETKGSAWEVIYHNSSYMAKMMQTISLIKIEAKRILNTRLFLSFLAIVVLFSAYSVHSVLRRYEIPRKAGAVITWRENLAHAKANSQEKDIDREILERMRQYEGEFVYIDETNLEELVMANYEVRSVQELTDEDTSNFYAKRLENIRTMLEESSQIQYTQEEISWFMQRAAQISGISSGYAEGWKALHDGMESYTALLLILIAVLLLPLFGVDAKSDMSELYRSAEYGKRPLDHARILTAFCIGTLLYIIGLLLFFVIRMAPFGLEGWNQGIQSSQRTFFSLYNITNMQQFFRNAAVGFVALLFVISLVILITVVMDQMMTSAVIFIFFWILLLLFDQMYLWPVNHYFANFMPLRMTSFSHYYVGNEIYRICGVSLSGMAWCCLLAGLLAGMLLTAAILWERIKRKRGVY